MSVTLVIIVTLLIATETTAQYFLQRHVGSCYYCLFIGMALYALVGYLYYRLLDLGEKIAIANSMWNAGTEISIALIGFLIFNQRLNMKQLIGLVGVTVGIILLT